MNAHPRINNQLKDFVLSNCGLKGRQADDFATIIACIEQQLKVHWPEAYETALRKSAPWVRFGIQASVDKKLGCRAKVAPIEFRETTSITIPRSDPDQKEFEDGGWR